MDKKLEGMKGLFAFYVVGFKSIQVGRMGATNVTLSKRILLGKCKA